METLRVLVTDDEIGMRLGVVRTLRDLVVTVEDVNVDVNFVVDQAESGEEALEKIRQQPPDILLLDHKMPGISGLEVLDQLAAMSTEVLTIMITAYASIETAVTATKRGAYDFLAKPFTPDELRSTIRKTAAHLILARQARKLTEEKRQVRFEFIRVLGHELKSPLAAVTGYLDLMQERHLGEDISAYVDMIRRSLLRIDGMRKLIDDLLDLTQIESGRKNRQLGPVNIVAIAKSVIESLHLEAESRSITVRLDASGPILLMADIREIEMIFSNLLSNAIKYNCDGGQVELTITASDTRATIKVADTGIGMSADDISRLFGEFVRIKSPATTNIPGSGLGLSIVKKLVQLYNGDIRVESEPDRGTTFAVCLDAKTTTS